MITYNLLMLAQLLAFPIGLFLHRRYEEDDPPGVRTVTCGRCGGSGQKDGETCSRCGGSGKLQIYD